MKGSRIKAKRITELQVALRLFLLDYDDIDHYERFRVLRSFADAEHYYSAFDSGVAHANAAGPRLEIALRTARNRLSSIAPNRSGDIQNKTDGLREIDAALGEDESTNAVPDDHSTPDWANRP